MKKILTIFFQVVIVLISIGTLTLMLWEPHLEGRNVNATLLEIYFKDPFLAYVYISSTAFFVALYQAYKALGYVRQNKAFSQETAKALRAIKNCAITLVVLIAGAVAYIFIAMRGKDDIAGGVAMGLFLIFVSVIIGTAAAKFERIVRNSADCGRQA